MSIQPEIVEITFANPSNREFYAGVTARRFKDRLYEHRTSFNQRKEKPTKLSDHVWKLKDQDEPYSVSWWVIDRGRDYNPTTKYCDICNKEKYHIMFNPNTATLNSRREIFSPCMHRWKLLLCNFDDSSNP